MKLTKLLEPLAQCELLNANGFCEAGLSRIPYQISAPCSRVLHHQIPFEAQQLHTPSCTITSPPSLKDNNVTFRCFPFSVSRKERLSSLPMASVFGKKSAQETPLLSRPCRRGSFNQRPSCSSCTTWTKQLVVVRILALDSDPPPLSLFAQFQTMCPKLWVRYTTIWSQPIARWGESKRARPFLFCGCHCQSRGAVARLLPGHRSAVASLLLQLLLHSLRALADRVYFLC